MGARAALTMTLLVGCTPVWSSSDSAESPPATTPSPTVTSPEASPSSSVTSRPSPAATPPRGSPTADPGKRPPSPPKNVTYSKDKHYYASPWYDGAWQEMIGFGCTKAPYYSRDLSCPRSKPGKHHGIDTFMPCGTKLRSAVKGRVVRSPHLGGAYGKYGMVIRHGRYDFVIGHARRLLVKPGQRVRKGQLIARSGKRAAPDGCHLHFEKRPAGRGYLSAVNPLKSLRRSIVRF